MTSALPSGTGAYVTGARSALLPDLDLALLASLLSLPQREAVRELRKTLRAT